MRPLICKCPNYTGCLLAYHSDDIEIASDMPRVCPECGTPLRVAPRARSDAFYNIINLLSLVALGGAIWFAWPTIVHLWHKATTPPARSTPSKR